MKKKKKTSPPPAAAESQSSFASAASSAASASSSSSVGVSTTATATTSPVDPPSALHTLLSPDGYYTYLNVPRPPPPPPGSSFLGGGGVGGRGESDKDTKGEGSAAGGGGEGEIDTDLVRKNYRRLSLRHHPDRRGGDAETFRVLNRAKRVLTNPKLRGQYDLLGLDLDDEEDECHVHGDGEGGGGVGSSDGEKGGGEGGGEGGGGGGPDGVVGHMASATLATILQVAVRTAMMGATSTFLCRYRITVAASAAFLAFISYKVYDTSKKMPGVAGPREMAAPMIVLAGTCLMYSGRGADYSWSRTFWLGECTVMSVFLSNSFPAKGAAAAGGFAVLAAALSLLMRGKFWRYAGLVLAEAGLAFLAMLIFPIMEMILEEVVNEKLRKIGEKVRAHARRAERYEGGGAGGGGGGGSAYEAGAKSR